MGAKFESANRSPLKPKIMLLDDEPVVTDGLKTFLELETDYEIIVFQSPGDALEKLRTTLVDVVISDSLMPEMDGLDFSSRSQKTAARYSTYSAYRLFR